MMAETSNSTLNDGDKIQREVIDDISNIEPGASNETMLLTTDSFEEMEETFENQLVNIVRKRSGTISEIEDQLELATDRRTADVVQDVEDAAEKLVLSSTSDLSDESSNEKLLDDSDSHSYIDSAEWKAKKKHIFVLSEAGKPIYSRYGSEDKLVTLMGVMQVLVACVQDNQDNLSCLIAGSHRFVFSNHGSIILVAVCCSNESVSQLTMQLNNVYNQIVSVLTKTQLDRIFKTRQNFDLRRLLAGSEKFIDNLLYLMDTEPGFLLGAVRCLPLAISVRDIIIQSIIQYCNKVKNLVFAILIAANQLVALVRMKKYFLHTADLYLIMNLVDSSESFKTAESWTPICLPKFDSTGYLHAHVSYLTEDCDACLLLLTVDKDSFFTLSDCKKKIVERLLRHDCISAINESIKTGGYATSQVGIPDLRHFLYKVRSTGQYTGPIVGPPYLTDTLREHLTGLYLNLYQKMHKSARPLKIYFCYGQSETILGWVAQGFELYSVFEPLVTKLGAVNAINKLLRWIKGVEDRLFILSSPTF